MKRLLFALAIGCVANLAFAYEFRLQLAVPPNARALSVIGYLFAGDTVIGNCSYDTVSACSGRGCHPVTTHHDNTCTWDLSGSLLSVAPGAPAPQSPLYTSGSEMVYAVSGSSATGRDTRGFGFVDTPASHYTWQTPNGAYDVIPYAPYTLTATLASDGDLDLTFGAASVVAQVSGTITPSPGTATIASNTCTGPLAPGSTCTVTVTYDPTTILCTPSPYGFVYTGVDLSLSTNAPAKPDFTQQYTVTGLPICDDDGPQTWYRDLDGDGYGDASSALSSSDRPGGYVADSTDCDDTDPARFPGDPETCDGKDNDCNGVVDDAAAPAGILTLDFADATLLSWGAVEGATGYDVLAGDLGELRSAGGFASLSLAYCLSRELAATSLSTSGIVPESGSGIWFLMRPTNCGGVGTYDSDGAGQVAPRDQRIAAGAWACP
jgi:Putative metal-binding motif